LARAGAEKVVPINPIDMATASNFCFKRISFIWGSA
jgi:hypothetical protein